MNYSKDENETILLGDFNFDFALPLYGYQQKAKNLLQIRPVTRILCWGGANEAKVDQTTEMYFLFSDPFI